MILIGLGSSLSFCGAEPHELVSLAARICSAFGEAPRLSQLYDAPAWPEPSEPPFVNAVLKLDEGLSAAELMLALQHVEAAFGRLRGRPNAARTLDLDILDHHGVVSSSEDSVILPHPRLADRDFALAPVSEVAPTWRHPVSGLSAAQLLDGLPHPVTARPRCGSDA